MRGPEFAYDEAYYERRGPKDDTIAPSIGRMLSDGRGLGGGVVVYDAVIGGSNGMDLVPGVVW